MSTGEKVTLKLVKGERYACPAVGDNVILKGEKITVDEALADTLLADSYKDGSNNEHFYFEQVEGEEGEAGEDGEDKPVRKARTKAAAK